MSPLQRNLADYLALRRTLGHKLEEAGSLLAQFVSYLHERGAETITTELALAWATSVPDTGSDWRAQRLSIVRSFATWLKASDPRCEVPPRDLLPWREHRATPYLYSEQEIAALMAATATLATPHRTATMRTLIGLLTVSGMRIGEAISLDCDDLDISEGVLLVRESKGGKSRVLPLHESTVAALADYLRRSDRPAPQGGARALFISVRGTRLRYGNVQQTFALLRRRAGVLPRGAARPRLHDMRHAWAVSTLLDAYRSGADVGARLAALATYLGHSDPANSYWYLEAAPELLELAAERLEDQEDGR